VTKECEYTDADIQIILLLANLDNTATG